MSPPTLKGGLSLVLLAAALGLLTTCTDNREHPLSPEVVAPLYDVTPGNYTITGTITDPDGNNICDRFPEGSAYRIWVIDPELRPGGGTAYVSGYGCPNNEYYAEVPPGTYYVRVVLPADPAIGDLPWRFLDPTPVEVSDANVVRDIQVLDGVPLGGMATFNGSPLEGQGLNLLYSPFYRYLSAQGQARSDGSWEDRIPGRDLMVQPGLVYQVSGCYSLGAVVTALTPDGPFTFPTESDEVVCELETAPATDFTHDETRLVVTAMPGDIGGTSPISEDWGLGWGVQFPVPEGEAPSHGPWSVSQIYRGGLIVGINHDVILTGMEMPSHLECGASCRDFGLDGSGKVKGSEITWDYSDTPSDESVGLAVEQTSFDGKGGADYVLFRFSFTNTGGSTLEFYPGFYGDWDVDQSPYDNLGITELDGRLMYVTTEDETGTHIGTAWLGNRDEFANHHRTSGEGIMDLGSQFEALMGNDQREVTGPADIFTLHGAGRVILIPGQSTDLWMAVVAGDDKDQLLANSAAAEADVAERTRKTPTLEITMTDMGFLEAGEYARARRINDKGEAVGYSRIAPGGGAPLHPFIWTEGGGLEDQLPYPGHETGLGFDINKKGEIAGAGRLAAGEPLQAWVQDKKGNKTLLGLPTGWTFNAAQGINEKGEIAGYGGPGGSPLHAFFWTPKDGLVDLGFLPGADGAYASDINKDGQVVGSSWPSGDTWQDRAYIWTESDGMVSLGDLNGGPTDARAINDHGDVVGISFQWPQRAFLWTEETGAVDLGTLPGHDCAWAYDINEDGAIVGKSFIGGDYSSERAFYWTWEHGMVNLGTFEGGDRSEAMGINRNGQIVGRARDANGLFHAVIWTVAEVKNK